MGEDPLFVLETVEAVRWLRAEEAPPEAVHGFSCREEGEGLPPRSQDLRCGGGRSRSDVVASWRRQLEAMGLSERPVAVLEQVHGAVVRRVVAAELADEAPHFVGRGDGLWTTERGIVLAVSTADCVPVLLVGTGATPWCAALHAGWRGICAKVIGACLDQVRHAGLLRPEACTALVGPAIGPCCYEVGPEVVEGLKGVLDGRTAEVLHPRGAGRPHVDLVSAVAATLEDEGLSPRRILRADRCTACEAELFWSHRRDGLKRGGMASLIMLKEGAHGS